MRVRLYISFSRPERGPPSRATPPHPRAGVIFSRLPAAEMTGILEKWFRVNGTVRRYRPPRSMLLPGAPATTIGSFSLTPAIVLPFIRSMTTSTVSGGTSTVEYLS